MDLVKFLAIGYKAAIRPLNPLAKPAVYKTNIMEEVDQYKLRISASCGNQYKSRNSEGIKDTTKNSSEKWHKVKNGYKQNNSNEKNNQA